jgi:SanA protein
LKYLKEGLKIRWKKVLYIVLCGVLIGFVLLAGIVIHVQSSVESLIYSNTDVQDVPIKDVAIVFGASVNSENMLPSDMLADRVLTGIDLYKNGRVKKIVMSGDNRFSHYNEPLVMGKFAEDQGVPAEDIILDYAGRRTYDTCVRAEEIFGISNAVLVTQKYHLYRALYTCRAVGIDVVGVDAARQTYVNQNYFNFREILATIGAFFDIYLLHPAPILGEKIDINLP